MSCIIRIIGEAIDVENFKRVFEPELPANCIVLGRRGGIGLDIKTESLALLSLQTSPAINFLEINRDVLKRINLFEGVVGMKIDFGVAIDIEKVAACSNTLPLALISIAAEIGLEIEISIYLSRND